MAMPSSGDGARGPPKSLKTSTPKQKRAIEIWNDFGSPLTNLSKACLSSIGYSVATKRSKSERTPASMLEE
jgi:hypothetical protein